MIEDWDFTPDEARAQGRELDEDVRWVNQVREGKAAPEGAPGNAWREIADLLETLGLERGTELSQDQRAIWAPRLNLDE